MNTSRCKSCNQEIIWAVTPKGKNTPLDAKKVKIAQVMDMGGILKIEEAHEGHLSHWATCPNADEHRRKA